MEKALAVRTRTQRLDIMIANAVQAYQNCVISKNTEWAARWQSLLTQIAKDLLPSGSGIDLGTKIDLDKSSGDKLVLVTTFHHMDDSGGYDGWTDHTVTVRPSFIGDRTITISGRDRNDIKEYLHQTFDYALSQQITQTFDPANESYTLKVA